MSEPASASVWTARDDVAGLARLQEHSSMRTASQCERTFFSRRVAKAQDHDRSVSP